MGIVEIIFPTGLDRLRAVRHAARANAQRGTTAAAVARAHSRLFLLLNDTLQEALCSLETEDQQKDGN